VSRLSTAFRGRSRSHSRRREESVFARFVATAPTVESAHELRSMAARVDPSEPSPSRRVAARHG
jgi:hypothetical protein